MADKTDALAAIGRYFATPAGHDLGAGVFNLYLRAVQERRGVCQITGADFLRMGKMLVLLDAPALMNTDAADKADAERALTTADESTTLDERQEAAAAPASPPKPPEEERKPDTLQAVRPIPPLGGRIGSAEPETSTPSTETEQPAPSTTRPRLGISRP